MAHREPLSSLPLNVEIYYCITQLGFDLDFDMTLDDDEVTSVENLVSNKYDN